MTPVLGRRRGHAIGCGGSELCRRAQVIRHGLPSTVVAAFPDPAGESLNRGQRRVEGDGRGLTHRVRLHSDHTGPTAERCLHYVLLRRPVQSVKLEHHTASGGHSARHHRNLLQLHRGRSKPSRSCPITSAGLAHQCPPAVASWPGALSPTTGAVRPFPRSGIQQKSGGGMTPAGCRASATAGARRHALVRDPVPGLAGLTDRGVYGGGQPSAYVSSGGGCRISGP